MNWVLRKAMPRFVLALLFSLPLVVLFMIHLWATIGP